MKLHTLAPNKGAKHRVKRLGCGESSGHGKTSGKGAKLTDDEAFVMALLDETGVALVHGAAFGLPGHMRLSYAAATSELEDGVSRIQDFCAKVR